MEEGAAELSVCATQGSAGRLWTTSSGGQARGCMDTAWGIFGFKPEEVEVTERTALRGSSKEHSFGDVVYNSKGRSWL